MKSEETQMADTREGRYKVNIAALDGKKYFYKERFMQRKKGLFGCAVLVIAALFTMAGCGKTTEHTDWPGSAILAEYGISGMTAPTGVTDMVISVKTAGKILKLAKLENDVLTIKFTGTAAHDEPINAWFTNNGWAKDAIDSNYGEDRVDNLTTRLIGKAAAKLTGIRHYNKTGFVAGILYDKDTNAYTITVSKV